MISNLMLVFIKIQLQLSTIYNMQFLLNIIFENLPSIDGQSNVRKPSLSDGRKPISLFSVRFFNQFTFFKAKT